VFQEPGASLNPVLRVSVQLKECLRHLPARERRTRGLDLLAQVHLPDPRSVWRAFPGELSGGMQQRVIIAMALACEPRLLVADEPTTALDVTTQARILALLNELRRTLNTGVLHITHNLGLVAEYANRVHVMYAGKVIECGSAEAVLRQPRHPYTAGLLKAVPRLHAGTGDEIAGIPGQVPHPADLPAGCSFAPRCGRRRERCEAECPPPAGTESETGSVVRCWYPLDAVGEAEV
jgi:oligopeptide transport system ATP-binding protein